MHHTVHMFCKLDYHFYSALFDVLKKMSIDKNVKFHKGKDGTYLCYLLQENGLMLILRRSVLEDGISYNALEIVMNPMRLLNATDYLQLADIKHCKLIYGAFKKAFQPIKKKFESSKRNRNFKFKLHNLDSYSFKRVDFAVNILTKHIKLYMNLIKRANIPSGFQLFLKYSESGKRYEPPKHSFYIFKKSKSKKKDQVTITINCYDKGEQLKENNLPFDARAEYTIRFEVQCWYNKIYRIIKTKGLSKQGYSQFLREDISDEILHDSFQTTVGLGDYYTLSKAKEIILSKRIKQEKVRVLIETLELVNAKRGIWKARETVSEKKEFDKRIKQLHELGVNPVTIPAAWGIDFLPCLFDL
jgi:hypothetical protein